MKLARSQPLPIGLDIGFDSIKMMQCECVGNGLAVLAAARLTLPEEAKANTETRMAVASDLVRRMLQQHPFVGNRIVASLPREIVQTKNLRLPMIPPAELPSAVEFEAGNIFSFGDDPAVIRYLPAGDVRQGNDTRQEVIVLAARQSDINNYLEQLHRTGAEVVSLDLESCGIFRAFERFIRRREDEQEVNVLVDVGARRTQVIIGKGREINFLKTIDLGSTKLHEAVCRKLGISIDEARGLRRRLMESTVMEDATARRDPVRQAVFDATRSIMEELGQELSLCLRYYSVTFRGHRPSRVRVVGGEGNDPQMVSLLHSAVAVPVQAGRPLYSVDTSRMKAIDRKTIMSEWTLAFGLGLKLTDRTFAPLDGAPRQDARTLGPTEVVDLNQAMGTTAIPEVVHA